MSKEKKIILSSILSFSILFSYGTSFALDENYSSGVSQENITLENEDISAQKLNSEDLRSESDQEIKVKDLNSNTEEELTSNESFTEENKDLFVFEGAEAFLHNENSTVDIYSHSESIDENSTIEFKHEDGSVYTFKSTKENSRNGNFYFRVRPTKSGNWVLNSFNGKPAKNKTLNFIKEFIR